MELNNEFRVPAPIERAWEVLTDVEKIAPCLPGAELVEVDGDEHRGTVKVKVGPITATYKGQARFIELDSEKHRAVLQAQGRETRGQGTADATITAQLDPDGDGTRVAVVTDLSISGRVAQFGRGVLADVSAKLLDQFAVQLEQLLAGEDAPEDEGQASSARPAEQPSRPAEPIDLLELTGAPTARRVVPLAVGALATLWVLRRLWRAR